MMFTVMIQKEIKGEESKILILGVCVCVCACVRACGGGEGRYYH